MANLKSTCVVKLGGSLLGWPDLADNLRRWLARRPNVRHIIVVGGGRLCDVIRDLDEVHSLDPQFAHWLCIDLLRVNTRIIARLLPEAEFVKDYSRLSRKLQTGARCTVLDVGDYLRNHEPGLPGSRLPANWDVTSDSIAARLAQTMAADSLVLLKSTLLPQHGEVSTDDLWDAFFPRVAVELPLVRIVNLRDPHHACRLFAPSRGARLSG